MKLKRKKKVREFKARYYAVPVLPLVYTNQCEENHITY